MSAEMPLTEKEEEVMVVVTVEEEEDESVVTEPSLVSYVGLHGVWAGGPNTLRSRRSCSGRWERAPVVGVGGARHVFGGRGRVLKGLLVVALNR